MIKIKNTFLNNGITTVAEGKLICGSVGSLYKLMDIEEIRGKMRPIIISETENINVGDCAYSFHLNRIDKIENDSQLKQILFLEGKKVIALPENFSPETLKEINEDRLKDGDSVLVECEKHDEKNKQDKYTDGTYARSYSIIDLYRIKLDDKNHITVFKKKTVEEKSLEAFSELLRTLPKEEIQKIIDEVAGKSRSGFHDVNEFYKEETEEETEEESWDDIDKKWSESDMVNPTQDNVFKWLKEYYNPPKRK